MDVFSHLIPALRTLFFNFLKLSLISVRKYTHSITDFDIFNYHKSNHAMMKTVEVEDDTAPWFETTIIFGNKQQHFLLPIK